MGGESLGVVRQLQAGVGMNHTTGKRLVCLVAAIGGLVFTISAFYVERDAIVLIEIGLICSVMSMLGLPRGRP